MAAGFVTISIIDGDDAPRTARFWSSDGTVDGLLFPLAVLTDAAGAVQGSNANPLAISDAGGSLTVDGTVTATVAGATLTGGTVAHDAVDSGNPVKVGARAVSGAPTAVSAADRTDLLTDLRGSLRVIQTDTGGTPLDLSSGTAGSPAGGVVSVQGVTSGTALNSNLTGWNGREYETVAASQTAQVLGATGGTGDDIDAILVIPATTSPGVVTLLDGATSIPVFVGGASSVSNLVPFTIPLGMRSVSGAWKITTGANVSCIGIGNFT